MPFRAFRVYGVALALCWLSLKKKYTTDGNVLHISMRVSLSVSLSLLSAMSSIISVSICCCCCW